MTTALTPPEGNNVKSLGKVCSDILVAALQPFWSSTSLSVLYREVMLLRDMSQWAWVFCSETGHDDYMHHAVAWPMFRQWNFLCLLYVTDEHLI